MHVRCGKPAPLARRLFQLARRAKGPVSWTARTATNADARRRQPHPLVFAAQLRPSEPDSASVFPILEEFAQLQVRP